MRTFFTNSYFTALTNQRFFWLEIPICSSTGSAVRTCIITVRTKFRLWDSSVTYITIVSITSRTFFVSAINRTEVFSAIGTFFHFFAQIQPTTNYAFRVTFSAAYIVQSTCSAHFTRITEIFFTILTYCVLIALEFSLAIRTRNFIRHFLVLVSWFWFLVFWFLFLGYGSWFLGSLFWSVD
jgi:hypothetical protein